MLEGRDETPDPQGSGLQEAMRHSAAMYVRAVVNDHRL